MADSVGSLLADIANLVADALRLLGLADKRLWGPDEHEQLRALDAALDDAKRDFQELAPLVHGQGHYERDRKHESLEELRALRARFRAHVDCLRDWARSGGPINPVWVRDTHALQRDLHRAQCRAARRIFASDRDAERRCLGAVLVRRAQTRAAAGPRARHQRALDMCTAVGGFERFADADVAFICDFCDGHLVWEDLEGVPTAAAPTGLPWQAAAAALSSSCDKLVVAAPVAVANHLAPRHGDWQAPLLCPLCDEEAQQPQDEDDDDDAYHPDNEFDDVAALQEHLEWQHAAAASSSAASSQGCQVM